MRRLFSLLMLTSFSLALCGGTPTTSIAATEQAGIAATLAAQSTGTPTPKLQGMGPTIIANTKDGKYAYVGFHLSETIAKVRLADLSIEAMADLSQYFPLQCYRIALDATEKKLFVHSASRRKLIVLDTQTLDVIHTIDSIDSSGMIRSQDGRLIIWGGGNTVKFVNTETYAVTEFTDLSIGFLQIQESPSNPSKWYVATQLGPGAPWTIGLYDPVAKAWIHTVNILIQGETPGIWDFKVLPNESKLYAAAVGGWYPQEYHAYGWVYSVNLLNWQVKTIPIDGGASSLETSPDSQRVYVGADEPLPNDTNNILVIDAQSDTLLGPIHLGRSKYDWAHGEIRDLQIDLANPDFLYAVSNDANAFTKIDLKNLSLAGDTIFNVQDLSPHFFARRPAQSSGYVLASRSAYGFGLDLDSAAIKNVVKFPAIRADSGAYDVAITNAGRLLIAQGEQVLEVDGTDMRLIANHPLSSTIPSVWHFVLSKDQSRLYSITNDSITGRPNVFLAINTADFQAQAKFTLTGGAFDFRPFELPDGSKLYVLGGEDFGTTVVHVIRTDNYTIKKTITFDEPGLRGVSGGPYYPYAYDSSSHTLYVAATYVVLAIDTDTDQIKKVIHLEDVAGAIGLEPWQLIYTTAIGLVYQPQENYLYIVHFDRSFVSIYDLNNNQFLSQVIPLKGFLPNYAFANDDVSKIYVINTRSDNISVIDVNSKTEEKVIDLHDNSPLYFPHIATIDGWQTEIGIINTSDQAVTGTLRALSDAGEPVDTKVAILPPRGRKQITVAEMFTDHTNIGYIIFDTDSAAVQGYTKFYQAGKYRAAIPAVKEVNTSDIHISHIDSSTQWWTGISLVNTTSTTKELTIIFNNGVSVPYPLNANEHKVFTIGSLLNQPIQPGIQSAVITNASGVIGLELFGNVGGSDHLDGLLLTDKTAPTLYYPHVDNNGWQTGIVAYNPSVSACTITITPYSAQGDPLTLTTRTLAGKEKYIGMVTELGLPAQTAWFKIGSTSPITGFELFGTVDGNQLAAYSGGGGTGAKTGVFPKIEQDGWTGIAFVNTEADAASVTLTAYDDTGAVMATQVLPVGGHAKVVDYAEDIFLQDISGATYIAYSSDKKVVGFQLNGSLDNMMLDGLPALAGTN